MPVEFVAEIGSMHKGVPALAYELVRQSAINGATIVKAQLGWNEEAQVKANHAYNPIRYIDAWADDLAGWCKDFGVEFMASIWSAEGLETSRRVGMKRLKVANQVTYDNIPLLKDILAENKETFVSHGKMPHNGMHPLYRELMQARIHNIWCIGKYPAYNADFAQREMPPSFGENSGYTIWHGYSDHSHGLAPCLTAIARGAQYIEKHLCLDKSDLCVKDTPFSATPDEFGQLVKLGTEIGRLVEAIS